MEHALVPLERQLSEAKLTARSELGRHEPNVRQVVLGEETGAARRERFQLAKAAVRDPWLERRDPYHPRQFTDLDDEAATAGPALVGPPAGAAR
jgi:hypothetical protein